MYILNLGRNISAASAVNQTGVSCTATPFKGGSGGSAIFSLTFNNALAGATGQVIVQTSPDNTTWSTPVDVATGAAVVIAAGVITDQEFEIVLDNYVRVGISVAYTAGTYSAVLQGIT